MNPKAKVSALGLVAALALFVAFAMLRSATRDDGRCHCPVAVDAGVK